MNVCTDKLKSFVNNKGDKGDMRLQKYTDLQV